MEGNLISPALAPTLLHGNDERPIQLASFPSELLTKADASAYGIRARHSALFSTGRRLT